MAGVYRYLQELSENMDTYIQLSGEVSGIQKKVEREAGLIKDSINLEMENDMKVLLSRRDRLEADVTSLEAFGVDAWSVVKEAEYDEIKLRRLRARINPNDPHGTAVREALHEASAQLLGVQKRIDKLNERMRDKHAENEKNLRAAQACNEQRLLPLRQKIEAALSGNEGAIIRQQKELTQQIFDSTLSPRPAELKKLIALGLADYELHIPDTLRTAFSDNFGNEAGDASAISVPVYIQLDEGRCYQISYMPGSEQSVLEGIQRMLLNILRFETDTVSQIVSIDPLRWNGAALGLLEEYMSVGGIIERSPENQNQMLELLQKLSSAIKGEQQTAMQRKRVLILHRFPERYSHEAQEIIYGMCLNSKRDNLDIFIISQSDNGKALSSTLRGHAFEINQEDDCFRTQIYGGYRAFHWFSAPKQIPEKVCMLIQKNEQRIDMNNFYKDRVGLELPLYNAQNQKTLAMLTNNGRVESVPLVMPKGSRSMYNIPIGVNDQGIVETVSFENEQFATFLLGASGSGKTSMLHTLITGMIRNSHPDDLELWLIDFKMTEFAQYLGENRPPHVRYILLDQSKELVFDILDRLCEILEKLQSAFRRMPGSPRKLSEVAKSEFIPERFIIIDEFPVMSAILKKNPEYRGKLDKLLQQGRAFGFHFIFASQSYNDGVEGLSMFARGQIQQRISMSANSSEIRSTLEIRASNITDSHLIDHLEPHYALLRDKEGIHRVHVLYTDLQEQAKMIAEMRQKYRPLRNTFEPDNPNVYVDKQPLEIDGESYEAFAAQRDAMRRLINDSRETLMLFPGAPRRMRKLYPIQLQRGYGENILCISPQAENSAAVSLIESLHLSAEMNGGDFELWSQPHNELYQQWLSFRKAGDIDHPAMEECIGAQAIFHSAKRLEQKLKSRQVQNRLIVVLCYHDIIEELQESAHTSIGFFDSAFSETNDADERPADALCFDSEGNLIFPGEAPAKPVMQEKREKVKEPQPIDLREFQKIMRALMENGPRTGVHFLFIFPSTAEAEGGLELREPLTLFRHRLSFKIPKNEAGYIVSGLDEKEDVASLGEHFFRYFYMQESVSFRPYYHEGLVLDSNACDENDLLM